MRAGFYFGERKPSSDFAVCARSRHIAGSGASLRGLSITRAFPRHSKQRYISVIDDHSTSNVIKVLMKAVLCCRTYVSAQAKHPGDGRASVRSSDRVEGPLLREIGQVGGEERMKGAEGALDAFESALTELVRENPDRYGAGPDAASQRRVVSQLSESVSSSFLLRTIADLRRRAGYVQVCGRWVHRAAFTFIGFGLLTAAVLPFCIVSLMSTAALGWLPGACGLFAAVLLGAWILKRVKSS